MADNVTLPASGTGDVNPKVATEQIGGAHLQRIKLAIGDSDIDAGDISAFNPVPVFMEGMDELLQVMKKQLFVLQLIADCIGIPVEVDDPNAT
jgi:hypothetical protein